MENKIKTLEKFLLDGFDLEVPSFGYPWSLGDENGEMVCAGNTLLELIENLPESDVSTFGEIKLDNNFSYLDEEYTRTGYLTGTRVSDGAVWKFKYEEPVFRK